MGHYAVVDEQGFVLNEVVIQEYDSVGNRLDVEIPENYIPPNFTKRLFVPKWDFESQEWVEGLSPEEVAEREQGLPGQIEPSVEDRLAVAEDTLNYLLGL